MHFKNYKSSELYILLNLIHLMSIPITSLQFIMHRGIGITRLSLTSLSRSLRSMPDNGTCVDPTTIATAAHPHLAPSPSVAARAPPRHVSPTTFTSLLAPWDPPASSFSFTCSNSEQKQIEQGKHIHRQPPTFTIYHANIQASVSRAPTHTYIQIAHACMQIRYRSGMQIRHRPPRLGTIHLHAKHLLATRRTAHHPSLYKDACMPRYAPHHPSTPPQGCH
jgi:hypothetical protein